MAKIKKIEEGLSGEFDFYNPLNNNDASRDDDFLRQFFSCLREGVWVIDSRGITAYVNDVMAGIVGYAADELIGRGFKDLISGQAEKKAGEYFSEMQRGSLNEFDLVLVHKTGREIYVSLKTAPFYSKGGEYKGSVSTVIDFSRKKLFETALDYETRLNKIISEIYLPLTDQNTSISKIAALILGHAKALTGSRNGYVSEIDFITGENKGHIVTHTVEEGCKVQNAGQSAALTPGPDGKFPGLSGHSLNTGESFYTNRPHEHPSSKGFPEGHIPIERFLSVAVKLDNRVVGQIALSNPQRDYSDLDLNSMIRLGEYYGWAIQRFREQKKLSDSEELMRQVFDASPNRIYIKDNKGRFLLANKISCEVFGVTLDELLGKTASEMAEWGLMNRPEAEMIDRDEKEVLKTQKPVLIPEESITAKSGKVSWFRTVKIPFRYFFFSSRRRHTRS